MAAILDAGYEFVEVLGKGGFGTVFLLRKKDDGQKVAVKRIMVQESEDRRMAIREASILCKLNHANIIAYLETFEDDDNVLIVTEFCEGGDLYDYLINRRGRILNLKHTLLWIYQMTSALQYIHKQNVLHRDLKTNNMFVTSDLNLKLGDMGLAKVLDLGVSKAATVAGTYIYMPPELYRNKPYNHKADIWSLGCCAYEIATLKFAFCRTSLTSIVQAVLHGEMPKFPEGFDVSLQSMIYSMLKRKPEDRPSCDQLLQKPYILKKAEFWNIKDVISSVGPIEDRNNNTKQSRESVPDSSKYRTAPGVSKTIAPIEDRNNNSKKSKESVPDISKYRTAPGVSKSIAPIEDRNNNSKKSRESVPDRSKYSTCTAPVVAKSWRSVKSQIEKIEKQEVKHMLHKINAKPGKSDVGAVGLSCVETPGKMNTFIEHPSKENEQILLIRRILTYKSDSPAGVHFHTARDFFGVDDQPIRLELVTSTTEREYLAKKKTDGDTKLNITHKTTVPATRSEKEEFVPFDKKKTAESLASMDAFISTPMDLELCDKQAEAIDRKKCVKKNMFYFVVFVGILLQQVKLELQKDIGEEKLQRVYDFFDIVKDDCVLKDVFEDLIGQQKFQQYQTKLYFLRIYMMKKLGVPNCRHCCSK